MTVMQVRRLYSVVDARAGDLRPPLLSVSIHKGVIPRNTITLDEPRADDLSLYKLVKAGDVVINRMRAFQGAVGRSPFDGMVSPDYLVLRPGPDLDAKYFHYTCRSSWFIGQMSERLRGIGSTNQGNVRTPRVNADDLGSIIVDLPTIRQQRAIADYLDIKTARVDALITKKRCMIELAGARYRSTLEQIFERLSSPTAALGRFVVSLTQGVSPQADNAPATTNEYGLLKLSAVKHGRYLPGENKALPSEFVVRPDLVPQRGDLMVTRSNTPAYVGDACVVDLEARVVLCDLIYRIRLNEHLIPQFAALALLRSGARRHLSSAARGTSQSMVKLRGEDIKATPIPVPPLAIQRGIVEEAAAAERIDSRLKGCLRRQIALLQEHQQALIAAAVTGEIEVPGAA